AREFDPGRYRVGGDYPAGFGPVVPFDAAGAVLDGVLQPGAPDHAVVLLRGTAHIVGLERPDLVEVEFEHRAGGRIGPQNVLGRGIVHEYAHVGRIHHGGEIRDDQFGSARIDGHRVSVAFRPSAFPVVRGRLKISPTNVVVHTLPGAGITDVGVSALSLPSKNSPSTTGAGDRVHLRSPGPARDRTGDSGRRPRRTHRAAGGIPRPEIRFAGFRRTAQRGRNLPVRDPAAIRWRTAGARRFPAHRRTYFGGGRIHRLGRQFRLRPGVPGGAAPGNAGAALCRQPGRGFRRRTVPGP